MLITYSLRGSDLCHFHRTPSAGWEHRMYEVRSLQNTASRRPLDILRSPDLSRLISHFFLFFWSLPCRVLSTNRSSHCPLLENDMSVVCSNGSLISCSALVLRPNRTLPTSLYGLSTTISHLIAFPAGFSTEVPSSACPVEPFFTVEGVPQRAREDFPQGHLHLLVRSLTCRLCNGQRS